MRLINTESFSLEEHNDLALPASGYANLSHRWADAHEEVTFADFQSNRSLLHMSGYRKLTSFCSLVRHLGYSYAWADTCCINKHSATELGSALNLMYRWYGDSKLCIVYLEDVYPGGKSFEQSEWFTRGWTLQELIAPRNILFYDRDWHSIGARVDLLDVLGRVTGIQKAVLSHTRDPRSYSVACRMSWAAGRETTRVEDRAYSLFGLFDVNLEMTYGEREKAFLRLQERIIQNSADQSIFTWSLDTSNHPEGYSGMFAPLPNSFAGCRDVITTTEREHFTITNIGLSIELLTVPYWIEVYFAWLDCRSTKAKTDRRLGILLARLDGENCWARIMNHERKSVLSDSKVTQDYGVLRRNFFIRQSPGKAPICYRRTYGVNLRDLNHFRYYNVQVISQGASTREGSLRLSPGMSGTAGVIYTEPLPGHSLGWAQIRMIKIGFDAEFQPVIAVSRDRKTVNAFLRKTLEITDLSGNLWLKLVKYNSKMTSPRASDGWKAGFHIFAPKTLPAEGQSILYDDFKSLNLGIEISLVQEHPNSRFTWTIDFFNVEGRSPQSSLLRAKAAKAATIGAVTAPAWGPILLAWMSVSLKNKNH